VIEFMHWGHPRWEEFVDRLGGPEGCNFVTLEGERLHRCAGGTDKRLAVAILQRMGFSEASITGSLMWFEEHSGYCDCEILYNIASTDEAEWRKQQADDEWTRALLQRDSGGRRRSSGGTDTDPGRPRPDGPSSY
jgi:hypothetical protein